MELLKDNVVLLAGATGNVGGPTLEVVLREGASAGLISRSKENADETIARFGASGRDRIEVIVADLARPADGERAVRQVVDRFGRLDGVANASGRGKFVPVAESTLDDFRLNVEAFALTNYNLMLPALRQILSQQRLPGARSAGRLITITAGSSRAPQPRFGLMGAAKAAVNTFMLAIAREHKGDGIVANALVLGGVATDAAKSYLDEESFAAASTPQEVAESLAFFLSARCSGINGALIDHNAREVD